jgi:HK97 family phage major capsid protein
MNRKDRERMSYLFNTRAYDSLSEGERSELRTLMEKAQLEPETRGASSSGRRRSATGEVQGRANEPIKPGQMGEWYRKACENNVSVTVGSRESGQHNVSLRAQGADRDLNRMWAERFGFEKQSMETRTLLEDTAGSGQAITPQSWTADFIDVLLPNTILGKVGSHVIPMSTEYVNVPVFTSTVSPQWIAESGSVTLDANPAFAPLQMIAVGGFKDITLWSIEQGQDAYLSGGLPGMLAQAVAEKMRVVLDTSMLLGVASNAGIPGLINEPGVVSRKQSAESATGTTGYAPADTSELGVIAELAMKHNVSVDSLSFVSNVGAHEAFERIPLETYGRYFENPPLSSSVPWVTSENSALSYTETDPEPAPATPAQTGGAYSSVYCGPFGRFCYVGMHLDLQTRVLKERYIDSGEIGLFSYCRYSIRFAHPETFSRTYGVITK